MSCLSLILVDCGAGVLRLQCGIFRRLAEDVVCGLVDGDGGSNDDTSDAGHRRLHEW